MDPKFFEIESVHGKTPDGRDIVCLAKRGKRGAFLATRWLGVRDENGTISQIRRWF